MWCRSCDYAANVEAARRGRAERRAAAPIDAPPMEKVAHTRHAGHRAGREVLRRGSERDAEVHRVRRRRRARARARAGRPRGQRRTRSRPRSRRARSRLYTDEDFDRHPELPRGYIGPHHPDVAVVVADPVGRRADRVDHRRERARPPRAQLRARSRLRRRHLGRSRDDRVRRRLPALREPAVGRPRHRSRSRVPARHEVLRSARRRATPTRTASSTRC